MDELELSTEDFRRLRALVYKLTGISLAETKRQLLKSRLQRVMRRYSTTDFGKYHDLVVSAGPDSAQATEFINAITTNKTDFFRENHHFDFVSEHAVPELLSRNSKNLRIWHAGCSTGEEPYSLAMTLNEIAPKYPSLSFSQLASDIDTEVLAHAETGVYAAERTRPIGETRLKQWFLRGKGSKEGFYLVRPLLQDFLTFRQINLLDDPWPLKSGTKFDLIFCRNVLIYFDKQTQKHLYERFHERLNPGGYLFLGHSESMHGMDGMYTGLGKTIYQRPLAMALRKVA